MSSYEENRGYLQGMEYLREITGGHFKLLALKYELDAYFTKNGSKLFNLKRIFVPKETGAPHEIKAYGVFVYNVHGSSVLLFQKYGSGTRDIMQPPITIEVGVGITPRNEELESIVEILIEEEEIRGD